MKELLILSCGGTICSEYDCTLETNSASTKSLVKNYLEKYIKPNFTITNKIVGAVDGREMVDEIRTNLVKEIDNSKVQNILVPHGYYNMKQTAIFIRDTAKSIENKRIILVSSLYPLFGFNCTDATYNLGYTIACFDYIEPGIYFFRDAGLTKVDENTQTIPFLEFHEILRTERKQVEKLEKDIIDELQTKEFFIPLSEQDFENLFNRNYAINIGAYDNEKLIAMATLYIDQDELCFLRETAKIDGRVCELGNYLVSSEYRGQGIAKELQDRLIDLARKSRFDYVLSTVHPENVSSLKTLSKELDVLKTFTNKDGYLRNLMIKKL